MLAENHAREYTPELLSRRGEVTAWSLACAALLAWIILWIGDYYIFPILPVIAIVLVLAAGSISLGNWMDRHTFIRISDSQIEYSNGIRHTILAWENIQRIEVNTHQWGNKIHVIGPDSHFSFRNLGEVSVGGEVKGRMGFAQGDFILDRILEKTGMGEITYNQEYYYYTRK